MILFSACGTTGSRGLIEIAAKPARQTPATPVDYARSWAVLIGIDEYESPSLPPLRYAIADVRAMEKRIGDMGFDKILTVSGHNATRHRILEILGDVLPKQVGPDDRVLIFFAGHGATLNVADGPRGYLLPVDGDPASPYATGVALSHLREIVDGIPARHVFVALDACFSGFALARSGVSLNDQEFVRNAIASRARQILTAGRAGELAFEIGGNGAFTKVLLAALSGEADTHPPHGVLTGSEVGLYVQSYLPFETDHQQTPQFGRLSAGEGEFIFSTGVPLRLPANPVRSSRGTVALSVNVPADVTVGSAYVGRLQPGFEVVVGLPTGEHGVRAEAVGYATVERRARITPGSQQDVILQLVRLPVPALPFEMDVAEVTNLEMARYLNFAGNADDLGNPLVDVASPGCRIRRIAGRYVTASGYEGHPVAYVSWPAAVQYCAMQGERLPTAVEWRRAAYGTDLGRLYPWGDDPPTASAAVWDEDGPARVGSRPDGAGPYGMLDMAGNVREWTSTEVAGGAILVLGGSWDSVVPSELSRSGTAQSQPLNWSGSIGFRCVRDVEPSGATR